MRIYIVTDLEGPAGVNRWIQTREEETPEKRAAMALLTRETNAAIDGILDEAPDAEVVVLDGHGTGGIEFETLHPDARAIMKGAGLRPPYGMDQGFDALFFVGQHAMAGTPDAPLCHTFSSLAIESYTLNGRPIGEFGCIAAMAGTLGIPTTFLSGDDKACAEARGLIPEITAVETKKGLGLELALHLSAERARRTIREGAARAVGRVSGVRPFTIDPPYRLQIRLLDGVDPRPFLREGWEILDARTVVKQCERYLDLFV